MSDAFGAKFKQEATKLRHRWMLSYVLDATENQLQYLHGGHCGTIDTSCPHGGPQHKMYAYHVYALFGDLRGKQDHRLMLLQHGAHISGVF